MDPKFLKRFRFPVRGGGDDGYEPIPDSDATTASRSEQVHLRPMYMTKSSSRDSTLQEQDDSKSILITSKRALHLVIVVGIIGAGIVAWIILIIWEATASSRTRPFIAPGDAAWLCREDEHSKSFGKEDVCAPGDGTPDYEAYFPIIYVILGVEGVPIARAIVNNTTPCPEIKVRSNNDEAQHVPAPVVIERGVGNDSLPFAFPVRVCEAIIEKGVPYHFGGKNLPNVPNDPSRYLFIGDTGLRSKPANLGLGACLDGPLIYGVHQCLRNFSEDDIDWKQVDGHFQSISQWPLRTLMNRAVQEDPDVLIHMGDFIYRQGPCPYPNNSNASCSGINLPPRFTFNGSSEEGNIMNFVPGAFGDTFWSWWTDFFYPSLEGLSQVPWIALRGNHESCSRAGRGWFLFLSPRPYVSDIVGGSYCEDHTEPRRIPFNHEQFLLVDDATIEPKDRGFDGLQFIPGDCPTESGSDLPIPEIMNRFLATNPEQDCGKIYDELDIFTQYFQQVEEMSRSLHETNFYLGHRPIFGIACNDTKLLSMDWTLQCSLGCNTLDKISALFSGHMHWRESITFQDNRLPPQIIVGHGGTDLVSNYIIDRSLDGLKLEVGQESMLSVTIDEGEPDSSAFGYAVMERDASMDYTVVFRGLNMSTGKMSKAGTPLSVPKGPRVRGETTCKRKKESYACSPPAGHKCFR